ncbi:hypothetical protein K490DRAFT_52428 [Saccharata proteae CBS 121410]|uniref:Uncharacterized protein n=1 Tax=Saccharata proteae CBS 121410 TaxID=1314787 RepID=A0A9P4HMS6_9PEZI|nr:hypothetical protein K490DRAFT_52428 [Saccharata proteae CBS 121410]
MDPADETNIYSEHQEQGTPPNNQDDHRGRSNENDTKPTVLHPTTLPAFIQHILDTHAPPTTLIICASRATFLQQLLHACKHSSEPQIPDEDDNINTAHSLLVPTLHLLSTCCTVNVAFCPTLESLRAYLSVYPAGGAPPRNFNAPSLSPPPKEHNRSLLALLNPIALHRETTAFSAQGLSRTMAAAVEAAEAAGQKLVVGECAVAVKAGTASVNLQHDSRIQSTTPPPDLWAEEISILNVATKSFGAGERGWVGRTVSLRRVVGAWCSFEGEGES